jgi:hypothetical protein
VGPLNMLSDVNAFQACFSLSPKAIHHLLSHAAT